MSKWNILGNKEENKEQSQQEVDALIEKLAPAFSKLLEPLATSVTNINKKFEALESAASTAEAEERARQEAERAANRTPEERDSDDKKKLLALAVLTNARITEQEVMANASQRWPHLIPKIQSLMNERSVEEKARPNYKALCENIVKLVVGDEAINSGLRYDGKNKQFFLEDGSSAGNQDTSVLNDPDLSWTNPHNPNQTLTAKQTLAKLGITDTKAFEENLKNGRLM